MELQVCEMKSADGGGVERASYLLDRYADLHGISTLNWEDFPYRPQVGFRIARHQNEIWLKFYVDEENVLARFVEPNSPTHKDSCVEFFIDPLQNGNYYNFEVNCIGTVHLAYGSGRHGRKFVDPGLIADKIRVKSTLGHRPFGEKGGGHTWEMTLIIPADVFVFSGSVQLKNLTCKANFYKCGDDTPKKHYLSWNRISTKRPDFHRPEYFGTLVFD